MSLATTTMMTLALAAPAGASGTVSTQGAGGKGDAAFAERGRGDDRDKWIYRWAPTRNMVELGIYGGVWFPHKRLELFEPDPSLPNGGWQRMKTVAAEIGLRAGYYPFRFFGVEGEGGIMPTRTRSTDVAATAWTLRGHLVGQLGLWSVTPFILAGVGMVGINSSAPPRGLGVEQDVAIHFGGGVKAYLNRYIQLRLDIRDVVSNRRGVAEGLASSPEILLGLSVTLGRKKERRSEPEPEPGDRDGDGVIDTEDECPDEFGPAPRGCPIEDCVDDTDGDGLTNPIDLCPTQPENRNGYQDGDGCPDEVPPELEEVAGVMAGITFDTDRDTIKAGSRESLDRAVEVMKQYPALRVRIIGHTDNQGGYDHNLDLSQRRADSVKRYMVERGIDASRLETHGRGPDQPIDTNDTPEGRAKNRRIEFQLEAEHNAVKADGGVQGAPQ